MLAPGNPVRWPLQVFNHRNLIAMLLLRASGTIAPNLHGQCLLFNDLETQFSKEVRFERERKNPRHAQSGRLLKSGDDHHFADTHRFFCAIDCQRFDFRQVRPDNLQRTAADDVAVQLSNGEGLQILIDIRHGAKQHPVPLGIGANQAMNGLNIRDFRRAYIHRIKNIAFFMTEFKQELGTLLSYSVRLPARYRDGFKQF